MNILLLYPEFPDTFWSFKHALSFVGKKAAFPPLGLLTIASMLPADWGRKLVDLNVEKLGERSLQWADVVFVSGMTIQKASAQQAITRCKAAGLTVVAGGPLFTMDSEAFSQVDHFVLNEAEITLPRFLADFARGEAKPVYEATEFPEITVSPCPEWRLVNFKHYHAMNLQYSRGCPFNCDFCNVTSLLGHRVRTKTTAQVIDELQQLHDCGWKGRVFFVDDNFIGNRQKLKRELLPRLIDWRRDKPEIAFLTEASIDLADDDELMRMMVEAGFDTVFVGIETPEDAGLAECSKRQNEGRDLVADVKRIQRAGLEVQGGFIVGFDSDTPTVFRRQIDFIQRSGIVTAMVGILQAPQGTRLYDRMASEGRITGLASGDNVEGSTNILTKMDLEKLKRGYREILDNIYGPKHYYERVKTLLKEYHPPAVRAPVTRNDIAALLRSVVRLGILGRERLHYWKLLTWAAIRKPAVFPLAVALAINGYHFRRVCELHVR